MTALKKNCQHKERTVKEQNKTAVYTKTPCYADWLEKEIMIEVKLGICKMHEVYFAAEDRTRGFYKSGFKNRWVKVTLSKNNESTFYTIL